MSWGEVKKINGNLKKPLDTLISECLSSVKTKIETEAKMPKFIACDKAYTSAKEKATVTILEVTNFRGGKLDFEASLYIGTLSSTYYPVLTIYVNGSPLTDSDLSIQCGEYRRTVNTSATYDIVYVAKELWLLANSSIKITIQTKGTNSNNVQHRIKYRLIGF